MYLILIPALACLLGRLIWKGLGRTGLSRPLRVALTLAGAVLGSALIYWGGIYLSILLFQWNDPATW